MLKLIGVVVLLAAISAAVAILCVVIFVRLTNNRLHDQELAEWARRERPYRENDSDLERLA